MEKLETTKFGVAEEKIAWEGLASSCSPPFRRLGAFLLLGFTAFVTMTTAVTLFYNLFGSRSVAGQGISVPHEAFYATMLLSLALGVGGYLVWLSKSFDSHTSFSRVLRRGGLDPRRPTQNGLRAYSDEQLLALRARYEYLGEGHLKALFEGTFGFHANDSFSLGPLSALPGTFELAALRVEWETALILAGARPPEVSWWTECRRGLLPRRTDDARRLFYALRYTEASVRALKRRYGYRPDHWHTTVPEGKLWDAVRDYEDARRIQAALNRTSRATR